MSLKVLAINLFFLETISKRLEVKRPTLVKLTSLEQLWPFYG